MIAGTRTHFLCITETGGNEDRYQKSQEACENTRATDLKKSFICRYLFSGVTRYISESYP